MIQPSLNLSDHSLQIGTEQQDIWAILSYLVCYVIYHNTADLLHQGSIRCLIVLLEKCTRQVKSTRQSNEQFARIHKALTKLLCGPHQFLLLNASGGANGSYDRAIQSLCDVRVIIECREVGIGLESLIQSMT